MKVKLELDLPQEIIDWLTATAGKRGIAISQLVEEFLIEFFAREEAKEQEIIDNK